jgi:pre-mRNA-splicing factor CWC2
MSTTTDIIAATPQAKAKVLKPARKQVKAGEVEKKETPQTGKEYSESIAFLSTLLLTFHTDIWYNKWAGGDREDSYSK